VDESLDTFLILGPDPESRQRIPVDNQLGIELLTDTRGGEFVYELKIPLVRSDLHPIAIDAEPGANLSLALDTPEIDREQMRQQTGGGRGGGMGGGMRGGMRGGMGGGGRGGMSDQRPEMSEPLKVRAKIRLAASSSDGS
jgi:hypothetical protein